MLPSLSRLSHSTTKDVITVQIGGSLFSKTPPPESCPAESDDNEDPVIIKVVEVPNARGLLLEEALVNALDDSPNIINNVNKVLLEKAKGVPQNALQLAGIDFDPKNKASNAIKVTLSLINFNGFIAHKLSRFGNLVAKYTLPKDLIKRGEVDVACTIILAWTQEGFKTEGLTVDLSDVEISIGGKRFGVGEKVGGRLLGAMKRWNYLPVVISKTVISG
tara:strand:+ start:78 stop:734 length:657 start_codon:yes stop_codon:yes gene_type:complete